MDELDDIQLLEKLSRVLESLLVLKEGLDGSRCKQYSWFKLKGGDYCAYALRTQEKFIMFDLPKLKSLIMEAADRIGVLDVASQ